MRLLSSWQTLSPRSWHSKRILPQRRIEKGLGRCRDTFPALLRYLEWVHTGEGDTENPRIHGGYGGLKVSVREQRNYFFARASRISLRSAISVSSSSAASSSAFFLASASSVSF